LKAKYVIIQHGGEELPIVFAQLLLHKSVAGANKVKAAGFCELLTTGKWITCGASVSLSVNARQQDAEILNRQKTKYIIIQHNGEELPIVFSKRLLPQTVAGANQVNAAGNCALNANAKWITGVSSDSLGLSARPQDAEILNRHL